MALPTTPPILSELRSSTSSINQVAALRALKNEIIGHEQKKRDWVGLGVLAPLARILNTPRANGKRRESNGNRPAHHGKPAFGRTDEEEARLQAIIVVGSLASGGPAFIPSIRASAVIAPLLSLLSTSESSTRLVLAALRTLNIIANATALECLNNEDRSRGLVRSLYTEEHLASIKRIILQPSSSQLVHQQISLAAALIARTCHDESQRDLLVQAEVLEALASRLSVCIGATEYGAWSPQSAHGPSTALQSSHTVAQTWLAPVLAAIGTIVDTSRPRITQLLSTPALTAVLSRFEADTAVPQDKKPSPWLYHSSTPPGVRLVSSSRLDYLLPQLPVFSAKRPPPETNHHPPIGSRGTLSRQPHSVKEHNHAHDTSDGRVTMSLPEEASPLTAWLIYVARAESGVTRLMAAWLISLFYGSGLIDKRKDVSCAMLLVPLLVRMLEKGEKSMTEDDPVRNADPLQSAMPNPQVQAPVILAMLTLDSLELQRAAVDAGAIKKLAQLLKQSCNPLPTRFGSQRSSEPISENAVDSNHENVGIYGFPESATIFQMLKLRESVLKALASIASISDEYRKAIIADGALPFIIESLKPKLELPSDEENTPGKVNADHPQSENHLTTPTGVLVSACATAKSLTRSVSTLRTTLMDAGLAAPVLVLLEHADVRVQIAATEVVSNLVLEFSPMREVALDAQVHRILCDHAHSTNSSLRFYSIGAIASLVMAADRSLKKACLSDLGSEWLLQIICNHGADSGDASVSTPLAMGTPNAAGEQVDLLNATDGSGECRQGARNDEDDEMTEGDSQQQFTEGSAWRGLREEVESASTKDRHIDDVAIQKVGLDIIRNLICGSDGAEMIDHLFEQFGQDKLFAVLISKLRPRLVNAFSRDRRSSENVVRQAQAPPDIVYTVICLINNMAAGSPRHRQAVIAQQELLKVIVTLLSHSNRDIRTGCAWVVINLTFFDDQSDQVGCKQRIYQLKKIGVMDKLRKLEDDAELDVRERVKTAVSQMTHFDRP